MGNLALMIGEVVGVVVVVGPATEGHNTKYCTQCHQMQIRSVFYRHTTYEVLIIVCVYDIVVIDSDKQAIQTLISQRSKSFVT